MKSSMSLGIPSRLWQRYLAIRAKGMGYQDDKAKKSEESRCGALNSPITPLALSLDTQMSSSLFKGHFMRPAFDKVSDNRGSRLMNIGGEVSDGIPFSQWVTD